MSLSYNNKRRMRIYRKHDHLTHESNMTDVVPLYTTLPGADRAMTDKKTNAAVPSDSDIEKMRDWSREKIM